MATPELTLYNHPVSSYAQKARLALRFKNLPFRTINPILLANSNPDRITFMQHAPRGEVPVLLIKSSADSDQPPVAIVDSRIIVQYLEDAFPSAGEGSLLPADPAERARVRGVEQLCDTVYEAVNWAWGEVVWLGRARESPDLRKHLEAECRRQTEVILYSLSQHLSSEGFLSGAKIGLADLAAVPIVYRTAHFGFLAEESPMRGWLERMQTFGYVKETLREFDEGVGGMKAAAEIFYSGAKKREYRDYRLEFLVKSGAESIVLEGLKRDNIRFPWPEGRRMDVTRVGAEKEE